MNVAKVDQRAANWGYGDSAGLEGVFPTANTIKITPPKPSTEIINEDLYTPSKDPFLPVAKNSFDARNS